MRLQKRSRSISLLILASTATLAVAACTDDRTADAPVEEDAAMFSSPEQCAMFYDADTCQSSQNAAVSEHLRSAPRYDDRDRCEAVHGRGACQTMTSAGGGGQSKFVPMMQGYIMGQVIGSAMTKPVPVYAAQPKPCQNTSDDRNCAGAGSGGRGTTHFYSGGVFVGSAPSSGGAVAPSVSPRVGGSAPATVSVSRGGFGSIGLGISAAS